MRRCARIRGNNNEAALRSHHHVPPLGRKPKRPGLAYSARLGTTSQNLGLPLPGPRAFSVRLVRAFRILTAHCLTTRHTKPA
jgi:hypothetical protein